MKRNGLFILLLFLSSNLPAQNSFDLVIVGGNPGGIMAAIAAARQGKTSVILERTNHIGGLPPMDLELPTLQPAKLLRDYSLNSPLVSDSITSVITEPIHPK